MSQITTHILDTSLGKPAQNVAIVLEEQSETGWKELASGVTNQDGRLPNLLASNVLLKPGIYRLVFHTAGYYKGLKIKTFYPSVKIEFEVFDGSHYHVPLLLNPFGYSTYRGS